MTDLENQVYLTKLRYHTMTYLKELGALRETIRESDDKMLLGVLMRQQEALINSINFSLNA